MTKSDWQPIETAPRDGNRLLLYVPKKIFTKRNSLITINSMNLIGYWRNLDDENIDHLRPRVINILKKEHGCWTNQPVKKGIMPIVGIPTHWMPLPQPPKQEEENEKTT